jgi:hypothetical protein
MQPIIPLWLIWFRGVCEDLKDFFGGLGVALMILSVAGVVIFGCVILDIDENLFKKHAKKFVWAFIIGIFCDFTSNFIPNQKTVYTIMIASQITPNNVQLIKGTVKDTVDYMFDKSEKLIKDVKDK